MVLGKWKTARLATGSTSLRGESNRACTWLVIMQQTFTDAVNSPRYASCLPRSLFRVKMLSVFEKAARYSEDIESSMTKPSAGVT